MEETTLNCEPSPWFTKGTISLTVEAPFGSVSSMVLANVLTWPVDVTLNTSYARVALCMLLGLVSLNDTLATGSACEESFPERREWWWCEVLGNEVV